MQLPREYVAYMARQLLKRLTASSAIQFDQPAYVTEVITQVMVDEISIEDRINEEVAYLYQPLSPAILRMLQMVIKAADVAGVELSVCGKMAGDPVYAVLLLGFGGVRELSMDPHSIPRMKKMIRSINMEDARRIAAHSARLGSAGEVRDYLSDQLKPFFEMGFSSDLFENGA